MRMLYEGKWLVLLVISCATGHWFGPHSTEDRQIGSDPIRKSLDSMPRDRPAEPHPYQRNNQVLQLHETKAPSTSNSDSAAPGNEVVPPISNLKFIENRIGDKLLRKNSDSSLLELVQGSIPEVYDHPELDALYMPAGNLGDINQEGGQRQMPDNRKKHKRGKRPHRKRKHRKHKRRKSADPNGVAPEGNDEEEKLNSEEFMDGIKKVEQPLAFKPEGLKALNKLSLTTYKLQMSLNQEFCSAVKELRKQTEEEFGPIWESLDHQKPKKWSADLQRAQIIQIAVRKLEILNYEFCKSFKEYKSEAILVADELSKVYPTKNVYGTRDSSKRDAGGKSDIDMKQRKYIVRRKKRETNFADFKLTDNDRKFLFDKKKVPAKDIEEKRRNVKSVFGKFADSVKKQINSLSNWLFGGNKKMEGKSVYKRKPIFENLEHRKKMEHSENTRKHANNKHKPKSEEENRSDLLLF